jgi:hypothetical protein
LNIIGCSKNNKTESKISKDSTKTEITEKKQEDKFLRGMKNNDTKIHHLKMPDVH